MQNAHNPATLIHLLFYISIKIVDLVVLSIRSLRKHRLEKKFNNSEGVYSSSAIENDDTGKHLEQNNMRLPIVRESSVETLAIIVA